MSWAGRDFFICGKARYRAYSPLSPDGDIPPPGGGHMLMFYGEFREKAAATSKFLPTGYATNNNRIHFRGAHLRYLHLWPQARHCSSLGNAARCRIPPKEGALVGDAASSRVGAHGFRRKRRSPFQGRGKTAQDRSTGPSRSILLGRNTLLANNPDAPKCAGCEQKE